MKIKFKIQCFVIILILPVILSFHVCLSSAEPSLQSITILYSNNINAEIDPCPV